MPVLTIDGNGLGASRRGGRTCRYGIVRRGRRKGQCLKHKRHRRRR
jgi:hypothetical protein